MVVLIAILGFPETSAQLDRASAACFSNEGLKFVVRGGRFFS